MALTLTVNGSGFGSNAVVQWNGSPLQTTIVNASQLTAETQPASPDRRRRDDQRDPGHCDLQHSELPGGAGYHVLEPRDGGCGEWRLLLIVNGAGLTPDSIVTVNGTPLPIDTGTFNEFGEFGVIVPASVIVNTGNLPVTVTNGGVTSASAILQVISLGITSINPTSAAVGSAPLPSTVEQHPVQAGDLVAVDRAGGFLTPLQTTFVSPTQLTAQVTASLPNQLLSAGTDQVTVRRPPGAGTTSNSLLFTFLGPHRSPPARYLEELPTRATQTRPFAQIAGGVAPYSVTATGLPMNMAPFGLWGSVRHAHCVRNTFPVIVNVIATPPVLR